ncbi:MAG: CopG family transcriptional regulator [Anaerolineae bacterium]|nr:CopG family transcriptional regulator [Anaerolineae bacterium]
MVRTQIQLTEAQARVLKRLATVQNISMAEVIRRSIDQTLAASRAPSVDDRRARVGMVGAFGSGKRSRPAPDEALAEAFE